MVPSSGSLRNELEALWKDDGELQGQSRKSLMDSFNLSGPSRFRSRVREVALGRRHPLHDLTQTNVPAIAISLSEIREIQEHERARRVAMYFGSVKNGVLSEIRLVEAQWTDENRRADEIDQLRQDLETFIQPAHKVARAGAYREFLRRQRPN